MRLSDMGPPHALILEKSRRPLTGERTRCIHLISRVPPPPHSSRDPPPSRRPHVRVSSLPFVHTPFIINK